MVKPGDYQPSRDLPSLEGKTIVLTGGTAGCGTATLAHLASLGACALVFTGRNEAASKIVISSLKESHPDVRVAFQKCDQSSLASVQAAAKAILASEPRIDALVCNAGIMATPPALSADGYEAQFATNHMAHALLALMLLPRLQASSPDPRVVMLTSQGYALHPSAGVDFDTLRKVQGTSWFSGWTKYGQSKLANLLFAAEISKRYPEVLAVSVHPGVILDNGLATSLGWRSWLLVKVTQPGGGISATQGGMNAAWAVATSKEGVTNGAYYEPVGEKTALSGKGTDEELGKRLWEWTVDELKPWMSQ